MSESAPLHAVPTAAERVVDMVRGAITATTGPSLVGLYLCGSLATGGFDERISDIDLLAVLSTEVSPDLAARLERLHDQLAEDNPSWRGRIEVVYVSALGLANLRVVPPPDPRHQLGRAIPRHQRGHRLDRHLVSSPPERHCPGRTTRD